MTPTMPLPDDQLDALLGQFLRAEAEVVGARARGERTTADALRGRVGGGSGRRSWILLAAALLLASAAGLGLTVGATLLRPRAETSTPRPSGLSSAIRTAHRCEVSMPRTWVVYGRWLDEEGRPTELVIHEDGSVFSRVDPSAWEQGPLTVRYLTPAGVEIVASAVADGVEGSSGCPTVRTRAARPHTVVARTDDGLAGFIWGEPYEPPLLEATEADQRLVTDLGDRIEHLDDWLPPDAWVDAAERPYIGQWLVDIMQRYRSPDSQEPMGPDPTRLETLASPRHFATFGLPVIGTPDGPPTAATTIDPERCQVADAERAAEIADELRRTRALAPTAMQPGWRYTVPGPPSYDVIVQLVALRRGELSCLDYSKAPEDPPPAPPPPSSSIVETPRTDLTIVCRWLDLTWARPMTPRTLWHDACRR